MPNLFCDLETFSPTPIIHGSHKYAERAEVMLFAWALDDEPVNVWDVTANAAMPPRLRELIYSQNITTVWHNGGNFDLIVLLHTMGIDLPLERVHDTMIQAYQHSLPGSLAQLCDVFGIKGDDAKDKEGKKLIQLFCKPLGKVQAKLYGTSRATRETHPEQWQRLIKYAGSDIRAMRELKRKMPAWNCTTKELALWRLDQRINRRGVAVDLQLAHGALAAVESEQVHLRTRTQEITNNEVESATQRDQLLRWICDGFGIDLPDLQAATIERRISDPDIPASLRELLLVRLAATTSSTAKYKSLIQSCSSDGRLRGLLQFCGAARTGRWAGRIWQPQNLPRPTLKDHAISEAISAFICGSSDLICDDVMAAASSALRGCIVAPAGKKLVISDLSNIEGRVIAWLARERWKVQAFQDVDEGRGIDLYILAYCKAFGLNPKKLPEGGRQIGKVLELSLGFGGGAGALAAMALAYGMDLQKDIVDRVQLPPDVLAESKSLRKWMAANDKLNALPENIWLALDGLKLLWRRAHPGICDLWKAVEDATKAAICGTPTTTHGLLFEKRGAWLRVRLPSGRYLSYPSPRIDKGQITYMGVCPYSRKWRRLITFGGKLVENIVQAIARDVLGENMPTIEAEGYEIDLTVHDEVITETPDQPQFNAFDLSALLSIVPPWAKGLPLSAAGFESYRYRKD